MASSESRSNMPRSAPAAMVDVGIKNGIETLHPLLFTPLKLRSLELKNRIVVSPMCQYSCESLTGMPNDWHLVHLGARAVGGAALIIAEATAVTKEGMISPADCGIWSDEHVQAWKPIARFIRANGSIPAIQLAHAGRKASTHQPWIEGEGPIAPSDAEGWVPVAPSPLPFDQGYTTPQELSVEEIDNIVEVFARCTLRALAAGFEVIEVHMAHGYLVHEFLSPLSNKRKDEYGGTLENRMRLALRIAAAVREALPQELPLLVRISGTDYTPGGWDVEQSVELSRRLKELGVDLIDCSSGGAVPRAKVKSGPGYQVPIASKIKEHAGIPTGAVGLITEACQAEHVLQSGHADLILLARELLRDPHWPLHAAAALGHDLEWPLQYQRAKHRHQQQVELVRGDANYNMAPSGAVVDGAAC